jgi:hypothetical protein
MRSVVLSNPKAPRLPPAKKANDSTPRYAHNTDSVKNMLKNLLTGVCMWESSERRENHRPARATVTPAAKKMILSDSNHTLLGSGKSAATTVAVSRIAPEQNVVMCLDAWCELSVRRFERKVPTL